MTLAARRRKGQGGMTSNRGIIIAVALVAVTYAALRLWVIRPAPAWAPLFDGRGPI